MEKILKLAINNKEWNSAAHILISFYALFVEGYDDKGQELYNKYINTVDIECIKIIIDITPFDIHSFNLQEKIEAHQCK